MPQLKLATQNIWNYNEPWLKRREILAEELRRAAPDLIGFQEIRDDPAHNVDGKDQAAQLAELLPGYEYVFQPGMHYPTDPPSCEGLAIFSRFPFEHTSYLMLSRTDDHDDHHQRLVLHAEVATPLGKVHFFVTHFSLSERTRKLQARELLDFVVETAGDELAVAAGDFNQWPDSPGYAILTQGEPRLDDVWVALRGEEEGGTWPSDEPMERIDYIFCKPSVAELSKRFELSIEQLLENPARDGVLGSDHRGLMVTFKTKD